MEKEEKAQKVDEGTAKEIGAAFEADTPMKPVEKEVPEPQGAGDEEFPPSKVRPGEDGTEDGGSPSDDGDEGDGSGGDEPGAITDEQIERAVKAGLSIADAKAIKDPGVLDSICGRLEAASQPKAGDEGKPGEETPGNGGEGDEANLLDGIPDLDPDVYDPAIVKAFNSIREIVKQQQDTISSMRDQGGKSWVESKFLALPTQPSEGQRTEIERKLRVLTGGYKASGETVSRDDVFAEAASMVLGDIAGKAAEAKKSEALARRSEQHIRRPSASRSAPAVDPEVEAANELDAKYFGKQ